MDSGLQAAGQMSTGSSMDEATHVAPCAEVWQRLQGWVFMGHEEAGGPRKWPVGTSGALEENMHRLRPFMA